jgi:hypothetical protein
MTAASGIGSRTIDGASVIADRRTMVNFTIQFYAGRESRAYLQTSALRSSSSSLASLPVRTKSP